MRARALLIAALAWLPAPAAGSAFDDAVAAGDAAWARRAEGHDGAGGAAPGPIGDAVRAYERALELAPDALPAHWRRMRALAFAADFATPEQAEGEKRRAYERAVAASESAFAALARRAPAGAEPGDFDPEEAQSAFPAEWHGDVAALHFWSAVAWGGWSQHHGLLGAVREGVAGRLYERARVVIALAPDFERGGAHRLLARLHATLPRIPLLTGWVDRDRALPEARRALAVAPGFVGNRLLLALTLLDVAPERRPEALRLLAEVAASRPSAEATVEELAIRRAARERLAEERGGGGA